MVHTDAVVLGGGLYGCKVALALRSLGLDVFLLEPHPNLLSGATASNQGRVHGGYHYPRSRSTALSAQKYYRRFLADHAPAICANMRHWYAIAEGSKVTSKEFENHCASVGAVLDPIGVPKIFAPGMVQEVYAVDEVTFDMKKIADFIADQLVVAGVQRGWCSGEIVSANDNVVTIRVGKRLISASYVFNCTYANIDRVTPLRTEVKKEHTEVALVRVFDERLASTDITIMDGPFWSLMKFPSEKCHALTHVKYTPHYEWYPQRGEAEPIQIAGTSYAEEMIADAARFVPLMAEARVLTSLYTTRVVLAKNEEDDGRPVLWEYSAMSPRIISILGSKFSSIYDVITKIEKGEWVRDRGTTGVLEVGRRALVGYTGFVGSNIDAPGRFTDRSNSSKPLPPGHYAQIICAAPSGAKWKTNLDPAADDAEIKALKLMLSQCTADEFILLSTIDSLVTLGGHYGTNRAMLEAWAQLHYPKVRIIRLPALFGPGLKKNALYDLMHPECHEAARINPDSTYQWYDLTRLWSDIGFMLWEDETDWNLVTKPIPMRWIMDNLFPSVKVATGHPFTYSVEDPRGYAMSDEEVKAALKKFVEDQWKSQS